MTSPDVTALDQSEWASAKARAARAEGGAASRGPSAFGTSCLPVGTGPATGKWPRLELGDVAVFAVPPEGGSPFEQPYSLSERRPLQESHQGCNQTLSCSLSRLRADRCLNALLTNQCKSTKPE